MSIYETTIKNPKKIAEFYKQLSEQKDIEIKQLKKQQKEFITYLKSMLDSDNDIFSVLRVKDALEKYEKIIGSDK